MKDTIVSFPVAKLAKEKGFTLARWGFRQDYYTHKGELNGDVTDLVVKQIRHEDTSDFETIPAPTQSLLAKWLRNRKVLVQVGPIDGWDSWFYSILMEDLMSPFFIADAPETEYSSYEEAFEAGLQKALELL